MGGSFVIFIIMGIVGEEFGVTADVRSLIMPLCALLFLGGLLFFLYRCASVASRPLARWGRAQPRARVLTTPHPHHPRSKFIEQPGIKEGSVLVKRIVDESINPRHINSAARVRYTVRVNLQKKSTIHLGQSFVERPIVTIWALRSANDSGELTDWVLPSVLSQGGLITTTDAAGTPKGGDTLKAEGKGKGIRKVGASARKLKKTEGAH